MAEELVEGILCGDEMGQVQLRLPFGRTHQIKGCSISKRIQLIAQPRDFPGYARSAMS
jgi:hypothetical protein